MVERICSRSTPKMSYPSRPTLPSHLRQQSMTGNLNSTASGQSPMLLARINEKKAELENLKELRDLSAGLAGQMAMLEEKLSTLSDGTEAVALVLSNWHNVLRAISMASAKLPKAKEPDENEGLNETTELQLPQTLVRIPTEHAPAVQHVADGGEIGQ
ncbi:dash complex subunit dad2 [Phlyctema vagabunda]|uniref:DASH complex subunit DAD2 n=1 Tax=Phlyctema vagabunda TaxID=108571 RepID=A0ABR4PRJ4_9HELO